MPVRVLIIDDDPSVRLLLRRYLEREPDMVVAGELPDTDHVLERIRDLAPDVVLMDVYLPSGSGVEATEDILEAFPRVRVIACSGSDLTESVTRMIYAGARGYIVKAHPDVATIGAAVRQVAEGGVALAGLAAARVFDELTRLDEESREGFARLELAIESLHAQFDELHHTYRATVEALAAAVELRDEYTGGHIARVRDYSLALAGVLAPELTGEEFVFGYMLHDVGKLAIPDSVLLKPSKLTDDEFELVKTHTTEGAHYVEAIPFLQRTLAVVRNHHERWDGRGYPDRLEAHGIPLIARIFTVADSLDAMTTDRPYRKALPLDQALQEFTDCAGTQFDPAVIDVFHVAVITHDTFAALRAGIVPGRAEPSTAG